MQTYWIEIYGFGLTAFWFVDKNKQKHVKVFDMELQRIYFKHFIVVSPILLSSPKSWNLFVNPAECCKTLLYKNVSKLTKSIFIWN